MPPNKKSSDNNMTLKEVSSKLDISESAIKKYLKDFDLKLEKGTGSKATISGETFQILSEIVKLRANGLTIDEIKELRTQKPSKNILEELEEEQEKIKNEKEEKPVSETIEQKDEKIEENGTIEANVEVSEPQGEDVEIEIEPATLDDLEESEDKAIRKRGFNYRYVERQISNDSKRVSSLRQRLRNPNLSVQDRLFFEEALERRILLLNGWKHILKWVSKQ